MTGVRPDVRAFFQRYDRASDDLDTEALASSFGEVFLSLDANSALALSPQALLAALPRRKQLFEAIGSDGLELADSARCHSTTGTRSCGRHGTSGCATSRRAAPSACARLSSCARTTERGASCFTSTIMT